MSRIVLTIFVAFSLTGQPWEGSVHADAPWPQWRGGAQNGVAGGSGYPIQWSENKAIAWKFELPGMGGSTPVIANTKAFLTAGVVGSNGQSQNTLFAVDLETGKEAWRVSLGDDRGGKHRKGSGSNPSAVTDGQHVYAYFRSGDIACVSVAGEIVWQTNLQEKFGEDTLWWDLGTSPLLTESAVVVAVMQTGPSYLVALDKKTGEQIWKTDRMLGAPEEAAQSYTTPLEVSFGDRDAIAVMGADHLTLHAMSDGREIGRLGGFNPGGEKFFRSISSPVAFENYIVCPYSRGSTLTTVDMQKLVNGAGDDAIAWHRDDLGSDVPTPAALSGTVYVAGDKGTISALDIKTGNTLWQVDLPKARHQISSSPLIADNHLYVTREDATTYVIGPLDQSQPELVATNSLADDEPFTVASMVPCSNGFLLRSKSALYRIGANP